ncbi:peptidylprolyl isomerase [Ketogulonicigenium vulgare]|uniref:Parvulin-like PPIase n=1 Tax=Ketogulonicigenium vulgare (strain WSH-001) TaxID=759362 RepID=F9Y648_KETVW|nr:peptidylprolyl isomerase [Ketogulonicigenium vulgare]ADO43782.1 PPIc-type PPIase domain protein [Ketogulonicigenium vulgare Y25]AEM42045.1 Preprotein translocase ATPase subunit [Ketogulonicigenium vulgare WSH-001]ALJ82141.1 peptidylprolyl isomerase [Ketogulonicigenium vulgare]ANW34764.1 peptidylprolyl isomerase [Ketogulonicigenium vulgare]AOZ55815.1 PPIc-type PPIase domain protein [Ketogulonicigenium vulgare]
MAKRNLFTASRGAALGLSLSLLALAPALAQDAPAAPTRDTVIASVNGTDITLGEMLLAYSALPQQYRQLPADVLLPSLVDQMVQQQLLAEQVTEVPAAVEMALANQRRELLSYEAVQDLLADAVTDETLQAAYDRAFDGVTPGNEYSAAHILVATQEEADAVIARLNAGEDFATVAQELSLDTGSGAAGGELGWFAPEMMVEPFANAVVELGEAGQFDTLSAPIESQFGFHIITVHEARPQSLPTIAEIRTELEGQVRQDTLTEILNGLEAESEVSRTDLTTFDPTALLNVELLNQE